MENKVVFWISEDRLGVSWYYPSLREWYFESYNGIKTMISNPKKDVNFIVIGDL